MGHDQTSAYKLRLFLSCSFVLFTLSHRWVKIAESYMTQRDLYYSSGNSKIITAGLAQ